MNKSDKLQIRISPELKQKIAELANAENRTISNYIEYLILKEINNKNAHNN